MISIWSWKLISIYRFWFPISKTNLPNWIKFLISSLQFDPAQFQFFRLISNSSWPIQSTDFQSPKIQLDSRKPDSIWSDSYSVKGSKFLILSPYPIQFDGLLNSYFPYWGPKRRLIPENSISFFENRERILLRISNIRGNGLPDRNTDFPFFCLPNWAIHSIDRNQ
jgi:hypothetical protein